MTLDYQSPTTPTTWYSYSFLQGNNASNTWISGNNATNPNLNVTTTLSVYGRNPSPSPTPATTPFPTILIASPTPTAAPATQWNLATVAQAPMFAKADPRSIRYNTQVGVITLNPTPSPSAAG